MDKQLSAKNKLSNASEQVKEARKKTTLKETDKAGTPLTLADHLAALTKNELADIRAIWDIRGASTLKKQELADVLAQKIPALLANKIRFFDETRYKLVKQLADRGGHQAAESLEPQQLDYFMDLGLIFSSTYQGQDTFVMPREIAAGFKRLYVPAFSGLIRRNTEWIQLSHGLLYYYGALTFIELESFVERYTGNKPGISEYFEVLAESMRFDGRIYSYPVGLALSKVRDAEQLKKEHDSRKELAYCPFTKTQLLEAGEPGFVDRTPSYQTLVSFLCRHYTIPAEKADYLVEQCVYGIRLGHSPNDLFKFMQSMLEINDLDMVKSFMSHIITLHNHTRQWSIKGYSPNELSARKNGADTPKADVISFSTGKRVGRNDPCPCGSGKKYKKCCGA